MIYFAHKCATNGYISRFLKKYMPKIDAKVLVDLLQINVRRPLPL